VIAGSGHSRAIDDIKRIVSQAGGKVEDWKKMTASGGGNLLRDPRRVCHGGRV
jgi:hypothetical protein